MVCFFSSFGLLFPRKEKSVCLFPFFLFSISVLSARTFLCLFLYMKGERGEKKKNLAAKRKRRRNGLCAPSLLRGALPWL